MKQFDLIFKFLGVGLVCITLSGCGFQPIYGVHESGPIVRDQLRQVLITSLPDRNGQILRNDLIDRMYGKGRPENPLFTLDIILRSTEEDLGVQADATSTRSLLNMYADYTLTDSSHHAVITGTAHSVASFNKLSQQYGTQSARESAIGRTINEVSEQIVNRISLYFSETEQKP